MSAQPGMREFKSLGDRLARAEAEIARINRSRKLQSASIGSGGIKVKDDGSIQFVATDGTVVLEIDKSAFTFDRADGTRQLEITPAGGMKFYESDGSTVITTLDGDGLEVIGGMVTPLWIDDQSDFVQNTSLTTTPTTKCSVTFDPPSWVETLFLSVSVFGQMTNTSGGDQGFNGQLSGEATALSGWATIIANNRIAVGARTVHRTATSFPVDVDLEAFVGSSTNSSNRLELAVRAVGVRD